MALFVGGVSWAGDTYTLILNSVVAQTGPDGKSTSFFTVATGGGFNTKYTGTYGGTTFTKGLKLNSSSSISFSTAATSTVIIVQSLTANANKVFKFDGAEVPNANGEDNATDKVRVYTFTDVEVGDHSFTNKDETGILFVSVEYTGAVLTKLATPQISYDATTGEVTIGSVKNATSVKYTTDGTNPSEENGEVYSAPFTVTDGTTVKAIALGDEVTYTNSEIASELVMIEGTTIAAPTFNVVNGTVAISCATKGTTIEYSTDGTTYDEYTGAFTLLEDGTVYARAKRGTSVSDVASTAVTAVSKGAATNTIILDYHAFNAPETIDGFSTLVGKDDAEGYSLVLNTSGKNWSSGNALNDKGSIKLSNGAENTLYLPEGVSATRITFYSYVNSAQDGTVCGWKKLNDQDTQYEEVPMTNFQNQSTPDIRVFPLTGEEAQIVFANTGKQLCFYIVLDVADARAELTAEYAPKQLTTVEGEEIEQPVLSIKDENGNDVEGLTVGYESSNTDVATVAEDGTITVVGAGEATITATVDGGETYKSASASVKISVVAADAVLSVTEFTEVVLTKENIDGNGYLSVTTDNWNYDKTYGDGKYKGDFYNMSQAARKLSIKVKGAKAFEALVQNTNAGRTYTVTVGGGDAQTIDHGATGVESSGIIECADGIITITLAGTGSSVYPVAIKLYPELPVTKSISAAGYATLYSDKALDFTAVDGLTAYVGTLDGSTVRFTAVEKVAAGAGVLLKGAEGDYVIPVAADATGAAGGDLLLGVLEDTEIEATDANGTNFVLMDGASGVGFYKVSDAGFTVGAGTAYLSVPTAEAGSKLFIGFDGDTATAIETIGKADTNADAPAYNLAGQRVNNGYKGIVVRNGRKVVNK